MQCAFLKLRKLFAQFMPFLNTIDNKRLFHETEKHLFFNERLGRPEYIFLKKKTKLMKSTNSIKYTHILTLEQDSFNTQNNTAFRLIYHA